MTYLFCAMMYASPYTCVYEIIICALTCSYKCAYKIGKFYTIFYIYTYMPPTNGPYRVSSPAAGRSPVWWRRETCWEQSGRGERCAGRPHRGRGSPKRTWEDRREIFCYHDIFYIRQKYLTECVYVFAYIYIHAYIQTCVNIYTYIYIINLFMFLFRKKLLY